MMRQEILKRTLERRHGTGLSLLQVGPRRSVEGKVLLFCFRENQGEPFLVCRASRSKEGEQRLRREGEVRGAIRALLPPDIQAAMPSAFLYEFEDGVCLAEPYLPGESLAAPRRPEALEAFAELTLPWLAGLQAATAQPGTEPAGLAELARGEFEAIGEALAASPGVDAFAGPDTIRRWTADLADRSGVLQGLVPCAVHGDYWYGNLRVHAGELRIVDWEFAENSGNPLFDPVLCLVALVRDFAGQDQVAWFEQSFLEPTPLARSIGRLLDRHCGPAHREAVAYTVALVVPKFAARVSGTRSQAWVQHSTLLARLVREDDPVGRIRKALWD